MRERQCDEWHGVGNIGPYIPTAASFGLLSSYATKTCADDHERVPGLGGIPCSNKIPPTTTSVARGGNSRDGRKKLGEAWVCVTTRRVFSTRRNPPCFAAAEEIPKPGVFVAPVRLPRAAAVFPGENDYSVAAWWLAKPLPVSGNRGLGNNADDRWLLETAGRIPFAGRFVCPIACARHPRLW